MGGSKRDVLPCRRVYISGLNVRYPEPEIASAIQAQACRFGGIMACKLNLDRCVGVIEELFSLWGQTLTAAPQIPKPKSLSPSHWLGLWSMFS